MLTEQPNPRTQNIDRLSTLDMLRVINDEDATVAIAVRRALPQVAQAVDAITESLRRGGRLFYVGAGTSGRLAVVDAAECVPTFGTPPHMVQAIIAGGPQAFTHTVEDAEDDELAGGQAIEDHQITSLDTVVGIAASGRTPFVIGALQRARKLGATTVALACNDPAPILELADIPIAVVVGPEVITGSTRLKAGTAQKMVLNMLSTASMIRLGKVYGNLMVDVQVTNAKLDARARRIITRVAGVSDEEAARLLTASNGEVKTAIVMAIRNVSADDARQMLEEAQGFLREVIGDPSSPET